MLSKLLPLAAIIIMFANCTKDYVTTEDLSNKEQMNELVIPDPLVWNSLVSQAIEIDTTGSGMKAGTGMTKEKEYPNKGYYFSMFEDLYPSQGDYDFNDVVLRTKIVLDGKKGEVWGKVKTTLVNRGGALTTRIGLMFYSVKGNKEYTVIDNSEIQIGTKDMDLTDLTDLTGEEEPFMMNMPKVGEPFEIDFHVSDRTNNINQIWIAWFIVVEANDAHTEIHTSGFPASKNRKFNIPQYEYLTLNNLPWGLEIEAEEFAIPSEMALFLNAYPNFAEWAESEGVKQKDWYENPDHAFTE